jgi:predicted amino acid-binding ACT domain protein
MSAAQDNTGRFVLTVACPDRKGIVAAVSSFLVEQDCNILDSAQFGDPDNGRFFLRMVFHAERATDPIQLQQAFRPVAAAFDMQAEFNDTSRKVRTVVMVSKFGHCLVDLLYRDRIGALPIEIAKIVSNHRDLEDVAAAHGVPFVYLPVEKANKAQQEDALLRLIEAEKIDLVVLARYMQILSPELCERLSGPWAGREIDWCDCTLCDGGTRRGPDHRTGGRTGNPRTLARGLCGGGAGYRERGPGAGRQMACGTPDPAERPQDCDIFVTANCFC